MADDGFGDPQVIGSQLKAVCASGQFREAERQSIGSSLDAHLLFKHHPSKRIEKAQLCSKVNQVGLELQLNILAWKRWIGVKAGWSQLYFSD